MTDHHHSERGYFGVQRSRLRVMASLDNLLEAIKREFSSRKMRLANSVVATLFIQRQSSRIAGVGVKSDARETMLLRERLGEVHQVPSGSALLPVWMNAQAVNDQCPASLTLPRQWSIFVRPDIIQAHGGDALAVVAHHEQRARARVVFDYLEIGIDFVPLVNALSAHVLGAERDNLHHARHVTKVCSFNMAHHID